MVRRKYYVLSVAALLLVVVVLSSSVVSFAEDVSGVVNINIKGTGEGYVIVSGDAHLESSKEFNASCVINLNVVSDVEDSKVLKVKASYLINVTAPNMFQSTAPAASFGATQPTLESLVIEIRGGHVTAGRRSRQNATFTGYVKLSNGKKIEFNAAFTSEGSVNESLVHINATVNIEKGALSEEDLNRLKLMIAFMTPEILNTQLENSNITWVHINELLMDFNEVDGGGVLTAYAEIVIKKPPVNITTKGISSEALEALEELSREAAKLNSTSSYWLIFNITRTKGEEGVFLSKGDMTLTNEGNLTRIAELLHDFIVKLAKPEPGSGLDELVLVPSDAVLKLSLVCRKSGAKLDLTFDGLKLKHAKLKGAEAESRIASILVSIVEILKTGMKPTIKVNTNIEGVSNVSTDTRVMKAVVATIYKASESTYVPEPIKTIISELPITETATTTETTTTTTSVTTAPATTSTTVVTTTAITTTTTTTVASTTVPSTTATTTATPSTTSPASTTTATTTPAPSFPTATVVGIAVALVAIAAVLAVVLRRR